MKNNDVKFYVWNGDDIQANVYDQVKMPDGSVSRGDLGKITIKKGDVIHLTHGASLGKSTMSGIGFEAQYPYGKISLSGTGASVVLNSSNNNDTITETLSNTDYESRITQQVERVKPELDTLKDEFIKRTVLERENAAATKLENNKKSQVKVKNALEQMEAYFGRKPSKP